SRTIVQNHAVVQPQTIAGLERVSFRLVSADEMEDAKRVGSEQTIGPHVPAAGVSETAGMLQHRDPGGLAINRPGIIDPARLLGPSRTILLTLVIDDGAAEFAVDSHRIG